MSSEREPVRHRCHLDIALARLERLDVDPSPLLRRSGLDSIDDHAGDYLPLQAVLDFQELVAVELDDPLFGLSLGLETRPEEIALLGYLAVHSPTLRAAFESLSEFFRLHQTFADIVIDDEAANTRLIYDLRPRSLYAFRQDLDFSLGFGINLIRVLTGDNGHTEIGLPCTRMPERRAYETLCGVPVRLGRPSASIVVPRAIMDAPVQSDDPALFHILADYAQIKVARAEPDRLLASVKRAAGRALRDPAGEVTLDAVASSLHMAGRTLQRRLRDRETTFRAVVDELRHALALEHLRQPAMAPSDVALALGFSELSAFDRAFRRWTGRSPSDYQRRTQEAPARAVA